MCVSMCAYTINVWVPKTGNEGFWLIKSKIRIDFESTRLGFPYSGSVSSPAPQRSLVLHTARTFHDRWGNVTLDDSGYFVMNLDRNSPMALMEWVPGKH